MDKLAHLIDGATVFVIVGGIAKAFGWLEDGLSDPKRKALQEWLRKSGDVGLGAWITVFPNLIDKVFGLRAYSWRFIARSCVASTIAVLLTTVFFFRLTGTSFPPAEYWETVSITLVIGMAANFFPDYVSLLISRYIVRAMARNPSAVRTIWLLCFDLVLTAAMAMLSVFASLFILVARDEGISKSLGLAVGEFKTLGWLGFVQVRGFDFIAPVSAVFFYAAFFTSVWVWLYVLSGALIRTLHGAKSLWIWFLPFMDIEKKPLASIGKVAGVLGGFVYVASLLSSWILRQFDHF